MHSCGMYDYAGEWGYRIGLAAKSGVGGGIIAVFPDSSVSGLFAFARPSREQLPGHRGLWRELSQRFKLHMFRVRSGAGVVVVAAWASTLPSSYGRAAPRSRQFLTARPRPSASTSSRGIFFWRLGEAIVRLTRRSRIPSAISFHT